MRQHYDYTKRCSDRGCDVSIEDEALRAWVTYNPRTSTYETPDGTSVPAELVDNAQCLADVLHDVLHIAIIRTKQRAVPGIQQQA